MTDGAIPNERTLKLTGDELEQFIDGIFDPEVRLDLGDIVSVVPGHARMRLTPQPHMLRKGDIVSGPYLMGLADVAAYVIIVAHIGKVAMAVTSNLNMNFLRACTLEDITADAYLLKLGRRLANAEIRIWQGQEDRLIAHATVSYALPG
ncbi:PaaI family thioesterase [Govanella unica]|uniref:PaaI family thioesterase n=1 Tax=Govanella unica TaxID=2975056 RepID=A0A9X3TYD1_9PROT|nr:PaaI family thioesterase [Govania unica]MDA5193947.1 PaaI family thioesterase [Govania unica]